MAIVQISQITNRKGLASDLPQLAGAELGWSTDTRQLWIGNGTLEDGAPVIGNTEILTEFSDILNFTTAYTYKGDAAGYTVQTGPTPGTPITNSLQNWLDQFASVLDFGAVGDGNTDCTDAINRALYQLYCREVNPQIRRSLFFPAGVYVVSGTIKIPPYAMLYGEGADNSVISLIDGGGTIPYVAQTADSLQQTGNNIGNGDATAPQYITITNLGFQSVDPMSSAFLIDQATNCTFKNVGFYGPGTIPTLNTDVAGTMGIEFASSNMYVCDQIVLDACQFSGTTWASYSDQQIKGIVFSNSKLDTLYTGFEFGTGSIVNGGPTGVRIVHNLFDNIYAEGIIFGAISLNASGYNIFYDVANHFAVAPSASIIEIQDANNISISDMFERSDADSLTYPRINLNNTVSIATTNGSQLAIGTYTRQSGSSLELIAGASSATVTTVSTNQAVAFELNYTITGIDASYPYRTGTLMVSSNNGSGNPTWSDDYVQNADTGIVLSVTQSGTVVTVSYSSGGGNNNIINYSINYLA